MTDASKNWPVQDAKARFSELLNSALADGPQIVTRRGHEAAVLVSIEEWRRLLHESRPTLKDLLLAPEPRVDLPAVPRGEKRRRPLPELS